MLAKRLNQNGKVIILSETTDCPLELMGRMAGTCWNSNINDYEKNIKRGLDCIKSGHGRVMEYPQIYMEISGYSARVIREFTRHIGGAPTYLQSSTRYALDSNFEYITPPSINGKEDFARVYESTMNKISGGISELIRLGAKREDISMLLPLGMETKIVFRTNLRMLYDMARVRKCTRAYWEIRDLFRNIEESLSIYSDEWKRLVEEEKIFVPKCEDLGYCPEKNSCGRIKGDN